MSKNFIRTALTICVVAAVVAGIRLLPQWWAEREGRRVAREVAEGAAQDAARGVADDAVRDAAKGIAEQVWAAISKNSGGSTTRATTRGAAVVVERAAFRMVLPEGSTVDPEDADVDREHLVTANLPQRGTIVMLVIDHKEQAAGSFDRAAAALRGKMENATTAAAGAFETMKPVRTTAMSGTMQGERFGFEIGLVEGREKSCEIIVEYPETKKAEVVAMARVALGTLEMRR